MNTILKKDKSIDAKLLSCPQTCIYSCVHFLPAQKPSEHASLLLLPALVVHLGCKEVSNKFVWKMKKQMICTHPIKRVSFSGANAYTIALWQKSEDFIQIKKASLEQMKYYYERNLNRQSARPISCTPRHLQTPMFCLCSINRLTQNTNKAMRHVNFNLNIAILFIFRAPVQRLHRWLRSLADQ